MDIARPSNARRKKIQRILYGIGVIVVIGGITLGLSKLKPAAPTVEAATLWPDVVKRGPMVLQVRGLGTLVPEDMRWISATTTGRVENILLRAGTPVNADSVILELSNPQLEQELQDSELRLQSADAQLVNLRVQMQNDLLAQRATAAGIEADFNRAQMELEMKEALAKDKLVSALELRQAQINADQLKLRASIAQEQLASRSESSAAQIAVQQSTVDQARALLQLKRRQRDELKVRAGVAGMLQAIPVEIEIGKQVGPGTDLARVANPSRLKAQIKIVETQAKDVQIGQKAEIDTHNGLVAGKVTRIDPSVQNGTRTVDISLEGELPKGAVPDLSVEGTVELMRLNDVLYMGRPAFAQDQGTVGLFKVDAEGTATRVTVKLGRTSVNAIEILSGLNVGDKVILSDMSAWDGYDRLTLK